MASESLEQLPASLGRASMRNQFREGTRSGRQPNFVLFLCDDLGYSDVEPYGGSIPTPAINRMAVEGVLATDYYAPSNICTSSRAAILTGRYAIRTGLGYEVILYPDDRCLPTSEVTIASALKPDYATALFGKWHLGHRGATWLPTYHGFDRFFGIPYSHDMLPLKVYDAEAASGNVTESEPDFPQLQQQFYSHAERFIEENRDRPFFVELALSSPHLPEYPPDEFRGTTEFGPYGDVVREIDSIVGRLLAKIRELGLAEDTIVLFTSDNGPWFEGSCTPLRDRKGGTAYDGGYRVPFIAWGPGSLPQGARTDAIISGIDILPTFCNLAAIGLPDDVEIDGLDVSATLTSGAPSPHEQILLFNNEDVVGVRTQRWKYVTHAYYRGLTFDMERAGFIELYDMTRDISESYSVAETYPDVTLDMQKRLARAREQFAHLKLGPPAFIRELMASGKFRRQD
jgi:arylsulfatase A